MRKINYPFETDSEKDIFLIEYFNKISSEIPNSAEICKKIKEIDDIWDFKKLLTADFCELIEFSKKENIENLNQFFKIGTDESGYLYSDLQTTIADFFISQNINIKTCFYCNIEFTNPFNQFVEYLSIEDFIINATLDEWIELLSKEKGKTIYDKVKGLSFKTIDELKRCKIAGIGVKTLDKITLFNINNLKVFKEHFTLDHFIPKSKFAFTSLSIFNLIPSCYSCNCRFKGSKEFEDLDTLEKVSPSSLDFDFDKSIYFKLLIDRVKIVNISSKKEVDRFLDMFKLKGRYEYHKTKAENLVNKRKIYSDSQIKEISKLLKRDEQSIKEDLFGKECFHSNNEPFEKYKQDIAEQLNLK